MNQYYKKKQIIAACNRDGEIVGPIEKWEAHKKGILHRAFTVAFKYNGKLVVQHRKHIAFDGVFDITSSSHQLFENGVLQDTVEAIYSTLEREWELSKKDIMRKPKNNGHVYYRAKDSKSKFIEHEVCDMYTVEISKFPKPRLDFAYGVSFVDLSELKNKSSRLYANLAPWVITALEENKL